MNIFARIFKFFQSEAHALLSKFEDPVKLTEQGIRDLKKDFDDAMKGVAEIKAIAIGAKKELKTKQQIADDYEQKALIILKKAQAGELDEAEADRLAGEALKKKQSAMKEVQTLTENIKNYDASLEKMENKVLELKNQIKTAEEEYTSLKARATVAKTTKRINKQLSGMGSDSTMAMLEEMKTRIQTEENLAEAYGEASQLQTSVDDEINKAIGTDMDVQSALSEMKQKLLGTSDNSQNPPVQDSIEDMKKELDD